VCVCVCLSLSLFRSFCVRIGDLAPGNKAPENQIGFCFAGFVVGVSFLRFI
jgi:hypothetical protein